MSPTAGPPGSPQEQTDVSTASPPQPRPRSQHNLPRTLTISAVDPPSSETGNTCVTRVVNCTRSLATPLKAVPPENTTSSGPIAALIQASIALEHPSLHWPESTMAAQDDSRFLLLEPALSPWRPFWLAGPP
eukprot:scaffold1947_cov207-Prasinococcus_capsulatus_cf.AAC.10